MSSSGSNPTQGSRITSLEAQVAELLESLKTVADTNAQLQNRLDTVTDTNTQLQDRVNTLRTQQRATTTDTDASTTAYGDVKPSKPDRFTGQRSKLEDFITQVRLYISLQPHKFHSDQTKVSFTASFLRDKALQWFQPHLEEKPQPPWLSDFELFVEQLRTNFGDPDRVATAERKLFDLRQRGSATEYLTLFNQHASILHWDDQSKAAKFYRGLKDSVKDELARTGRPKDFYELTTAAIRIDNRLYERSVEKGGSNRTTSTGKFTRYADTPRGNSNSNSNWNRMYSNPNSYSNSNRSFNRSSTPPRNTNLLRNGHLAPEEYQKRKDAGLCLYCGSKDHKVDKCPNSKKPKPSSSLGKA